MASYQPYLIANSATALDNSRQPWLLPDDAQETLYDGFVYRGVWQKRQGYSYFAFGERGGQPYSESRIVNRISNFSMVGAINSSNRTYTLAAKAPIRRGTFVVTGSTPSQVLTDNGLGIFTGAGTGTINYTTGAVSITFTLAPTGGTVQATYDYYPGNPVMMIANFYTATNTEELIVADTEYVNKYNSVLNILSDISPSTPYTGNSSNFFSWTNYPSATDDPRLLFSNSVDAIQQYDGTTVTDYSFTPPTGVTIMLGQLLFQFKDRLVILRTTEDGVRKPLRIRISGTGASCDDFSGTAVGAGVIDLPDYGAIQGAAFNRDDLLIFTDNSTWSLKYTNNDVVPFIPERLDPSRGSAAPFAPITYLGNTTTISRIGFISTDGYRAVRIDDQIPDYSYNNIDQNHLNLCFSGSVDIDRDHYLIHPSPEQEESDRILVRNYEEENYAVYRIPLSCMGNFANSSDVSWNDLNIYPNWDAMASEYDTWYDFAYTEGTPISIAGGHHGEIWEIGSSETLDNPIKIRGISVSGNIATITTDFQSLQIGQYIFFNAITGSIQLNNKQLAVLSVIDEYNVTVDITSIGTVSSYISAGEISVPIPFESTSKKFNPFVNNAAKVRCGWMYFYVSTTSTYLTDNSGNAIPPILSVDIIVNDREEKTSLENGYLQPIPDPYQVNCGETDSGEGIKKWYKIFINQTGRFIQFRVRNNQAGADIKIQAIMPGFAPVGRLI